MNALSYIMQQGSEQKKVIIRVSFGKLYAVMFALLPVFSGLRIPFTQIAVDRAMLAVFTVCIGLKLLRRNFFPKDLLFGYLFFTYYIFRAGGDYIHYFIYALICIINILAFYYQMEDMQTLKLIFILIAVIASVLVITQTVFHYVFGIHIQMRFSQLVLSDQTGYEYLWKTGYSFFGNTSYRPCAFFGEPSHMSQYNFIGLLFSLYGWARNGCKVGKSVLITLGMILTTSSMGLLFVIGCWTWAIYVKGNKKMIKRMLGALCIAGVLFLIVYTAYRLKLFNIDYIFGRLVGEVEGYNAIAGRTFANKYYLTQIRGKALLYGYGLVNRPDVYMVGMSGFRYTIGWIGVGLFIAMMLFSIRHLHYVPSAIAIAFVALTFAAQTNQLMALVFFIPLAYAQTRQPEEG